MANKQTQANGTGKVKSLEEINIILSEQLDALRSGDVSVAVAEATTNTVGKMFTGAMLQLKFAQLIGRVPDIPMLMEATQHVAER